MIKKDWNSKWIIEKYIWIKSNVIKFIALLILIYLFEVINLFFLWDFYQQSYLFILIFSFFNLFLLSSFINLYFLLIIILFLPNLFFKFLFLSLYFYLNISIIKINQKIWVINILYIKIILINFLFKAFYIYFFFSSFTSIYNLLAYNRSLMFLCLFKLYNI